MKNEKGISMWAVILLIAVLIGAAILWSKYFAKPMATVMMGGAPAGSAGDRKSPQGQ